MLILPQISTLAITREDGAAAPHKVWNTASLLTWGFWNGRIAIPTKPSLPSELPTFRLTSPQEEKRLATTTEQGNGASEASHERRAPFSKCVQSSLQKNEERPLGVESTRKQLTQPRHLTATEPGRK